MNFKKEKTIHRLKKVGATALGLILLSGQIGAVIIERECDFFTPDGGPLTGTFIVAYDPALRNQDDVAFSWDLQGEAIYADSVLLSVVPHCFSLEYCTPIPPFEEGDCILDAESPPACCFGAVGPLGSGELGVGTASFAGLCPANCASLTANVEVQTDLYEVLFGTCTIDLAFVDFSLSSCRLCYGNCDCIKLALTVTNNTDEDFSYGEISFTVNEPNDLTFTGVCESTNVSNDGTTVTINEELAAGGSKTLCLCYTVSACPCAGRREILINDCQGITIELVNFQTSQSSAVVSAISRNTQTACCKTTTCCPSNPCKQSCCPKPTCCKTKTTCCPTTTTVSSSCCPSNPCKKTCCPKPTCCKTKTTCCPTTTTVSSSCCPSNPCKKTCCPKPTCCKTKTTCCPTTTTVSSSCCPSNPCKKTTCSTCCN